MWQSKPSTGHFMPLTNWMNECFIKCTFVTFKWTSQHWQSSNSLLSRGTITVTCNLWVMYFTWCCQTHASHNRKFTCVSDNLRHHLLSLCTDKNTFTSSLSDWSWFAENESFQSLSLVRCLCIFQLTDEMLMHLSKPKNQTICGQDLVCHNLKIICMYVSHLFWCTTDCSSKSLSCLSFSLSFEHGAMSWSSPMFSLAAILMHTALPTVSLTQAAVVGGAWGLWLIKPEFF